jgi:STAM-binding protein
MPSQLQGTYGAAISPVVVSRAKRQDSGREVARPAVSSDSGHNNIRQSTSINDISRDMDGMRLGASPETRRPRSDTLRKMEEAERQQWQEQEIARRQEEDAARLAQEQAARRQWDIDQELDRRAREESRRRTEYEQSQRIKSAALDAARQAAGYNPQSSRYRESSIALTASPPPTARSTSQFDALPHHPLQDPSILQTELQDQSSTPIWQENHTPTATRSHRPLYQQQPSPLDMSFSPNIHIQYPQLMSAHQRAQGYHPSVLFGSPQTNRGSGSSSFYNITLPQQATPIKYPPRTNSMAQPQYSPAPPPASVHPPQAAASNPGYPMYDNTGPSRTSRSQQPAVSGTHKRQSSMQEIPNHPLGFRPIDMPAELLDRFLGVARLNTLRKIETCGLLLGKPRGAGFTISTLLIPEQRGTPDTCIMESEELVVEFSTGRDMLTLGWVRTDVSVCGKLLIFHNWQIHTHPTQSCMQQISCYDWFLIFLQASCLHWICIRMQHTRAP